ncbi:ECF transporter S component [Ruminococcus sp. OA3]|uniref:ECF transporter S component n=1 Tax=Ruminococcus sp. OA3 TaxID=2914164 RepID=UPI001F066A56|nr:ECF transporter S component [Ruminococcus sp. OA3]MCH1983566.1 ECF transporter S component [Ruminococcus sp. OA3]
MNQSTQTAVRETNHIKSLTLTAVFIALTYVFTAFVNIRLPIAANGGLIHLGNVPLFIGAMIFGKRTGAIAGGVGMAMFDLLSGWTAWAPFTLVIVGLMGFTVGLIAEKHRGLGWYALAVIVACVIKVAGYYLAEVILYGNWLTPAGSIPGNLVQIGTAAVLTLPIVGRLRTAAEKFGPGRRTC